MIETMDEYPAWPGRAAGARVAAALFVAMLDPDGRGEGEPVTFINPEITAVAQTWSRRWEGCLSIPDVRGRVPRSPHIKVSALDRDRQAIRARAQATSPRASSSTRPIIWTACFSSTGCARSSR